MKKKSFIVLLLLLGIGMGIQKSQAQGIGSDKRNNIKLNVGLFTKIKLTYEVSLSDRLSTGISGCSSIGLSAFRGYKIEPFFRLYTRPQTGSGLYFQARTYYYNLVTTTTSTTYSGLHYRGGGMGSDIGYQYFFGQNESTLLDFSLGMQISPNYSKNEHEDLVFISTGPCSFFTPRVAIGYRF